MRARNHSFEVQIERDGRWVMEAVLDGKTAAIAMARSMAGSGDCDGTRVVEDATLFVIPVEVFRARLTEVAEIDCLIPLMLTRYVERLRSHVSHD